MEAKTLETLQVPINEERPWMVFSACRDKDPDLFFSEDRATMQQAKSICATCPVEMDCLEYAIEADIRFGVWGGMSPKQRRMFLRSVAS